MKKYILPLLVAFAMAACSSEPAPVENVTEAEKQGRADAKALSEANFTSSRDLHSALLAIKAREWQIRNSAGTQQSDAYLTAFRAYLTENDQSLANQIF